MAIVVVGPPGAGKGTRIEEAKKVIPNLESISTGNVLRKNKIDVSSGKLIPDAVVMEFLKKELKSVKAEIIILDGVPRTVPQAEAMMKSGIEVDFVIYLPISEEVAVERAKDRLFCSNSACQLTYTKGDFNPPKVEGICDNCGSELITRPDDKEETVRERLEIYREKTEPLLEWWRAHDIPIKTVDANSSMDLFVEALLE